MVVSFKNILFLHTFLCIEYCHPESTENEHQLPSVDGVFNSYVILESGLSI
jgi:hypothetical protein